MDQPTPQSPLLGSLRLMDLGRLQRTYTLVTCVIFPFAI
jgi:hypothetical protein